MRYVGRSHNFEIAPVEGKDASQFKTLCNSNYRSVNKIDAGIGILFENLRSSDEIPLFKRNRSIFCF